MASKRPGGLGRSLSDMGMRPEQGSGLGSLFPEEDVRAEARKPGQTIELSQIESCATQPRKYFNEEALQALSDSIAAHGVLEPIVVRRLASGYYQIIAGERRWRAAKMAGLSEIPAVIIEATDAEAAIMALIENLQREDLNPIEQAEGYAALIEHYHYTQEEAARQLDKSRSDIANMMRLLKLEPAVRAMVEDGTLTAGHARALLALEGEQQESTARKIVEAELSVRQTEALVKKLTQPQPEEPEKAEESVDYKKEAEQQLANTLGRHVKIVQGRKKGRVELEYYGLDDLNDLLEALSAIRAKKKENLPS